MPRVFFKNFRSLLITVSGLVIAASISGCGHMGMVGSQDYQYFGPWGGRPNNYVPKEAQRVQPWLPLGSKKES